MPHLLASKIFSSFLNYKTNILVSHKVPQVLVFFSGSHSVYIISDSRKGKTKKKKKLWRGMSINDSTNQ